MDLPSILESLLVASESPLPSSELARLVRARAAEFSEDSITENPENAPAPDSPERVLDLETLSKTSENEVKDGLLELRWVCEASFSRSQARATQPTSYGDPRNHRLSPTGHQIGP